MKHPAYHLRPNKTAERFAFIEAIRRLDHLSDEGLSGYTYHGLGGPYLEDFRLLYESCPNTSMVSIEANCETFKRQRFHLPSSNVQLVNSDVASFIAQFDPNSTKSIFWLDYTKLEYRCFEDFRTLLNLVEEMSMIKVTLRCNPSDFHAIANEGERREKIEEFHAEFGSVMPPNTFGLPRGREEFAKLLQEMLRTASEKALQPSATTLVFVPVSSFYYRDTAGMFTLTGVVCKNKNKKDVELAYQDWPFANSDWDTPKPINVPVLSTKERLHLQHLIPSTSAAGPILLQALGYLIDDDVPKTINTLEQYADFHRYSPYVMRAVP